MSALRNRGVRAALAAALLFGVATPLAKVLLGEVSVWMLAALLYLGSGVGLAVVRRLRRAPRVHLPRADVPWLAAAVALGGVAAPVLLMLGLTGTSAANASLLLNVEGVLTALIAWVVFRENVDLRVGLGMLAILIGVVVLTWSPGTTPLDLWPTLAIVAACACWALDNNLTRRVSLADASWIAMVKGLVAGSVNLVLALALGAQVPAWPYAVGAAVLGFVSYGLSLTLFVVALRHLGTARSGAYFSLAPFVGALVALALGSPVTWQLAIAGLLMAVGTWLHLSESHHHRHAHDEVVHRHAFPHDQAHPPSQAPGDDGGSHRHPPLEHDHPHYPDTHHPHEH